MISIKFNCDLIMNAFLSLAHDRFSTECLAVSFPGHIESTTFHLQIISDNTMFADSLIKSEYTVWIMFIQTCYSFQDMWRNWGPL
jgi:hypothetical protein